MQNICLEAKLINPLTYTVQRTLYTVPMYKRKRYNLYVVQCTVYISQEIFTYSATVRRTMYVVHVQCTSYVVRRMSYVVQWRVTIPIYTISPITSNIICLTLYEYLYYIYSWQDYILHIWYGVMCITYEYIYTSIIICICIST